MKLYQKYYVAIKPRSELAYVISLSGSKANIAKQKINGVSCLMTVEDFLANK